MAEIRTLRAALDPKREAREIAREVAPRIGRTVTAVDAMIHRIQASARYTSPSPFRPWTASDIATLDAAIDSGPHLPYGAVPRLARSLGRTLQAVRQALYLRRIERGLVKRRGGGVR